jgi:hypothetical protein
VQTSFIEPLSSNFSALSANLSDGLKSLDMKLLQSSQEMATRTLNSFRNLSASLGTNISTLRDSLAELDSRQEEALGQTRSTFAAQLAAANELLAEQTFQNLSSLNASLLQSALEQQSLLASQLNSQLFALNSSLSDQWTAAAHRLSSSEDSLTELAARLNLTSQAVETQLETRLMDASEELLSSVAQLNSSLQLGLLLSENRTLTQLEQLRVSLQSDLSIAKADLSGGLQFLETSLSDALSVFNSSVSALETSLQLSNQQLSSLSSNTSQAIARSNAILTRVIAEVNVSLTEYKNASVSSFEEMFESFSLSLHSAQAALRTDFQLSIQETGRELRNETQELGAELRQLNSSLREKFSRLENYANNSASALSDSVGDLRRVLDESQRTVEAQLLSTNISLVSEISGLSASLSSLLNSTAQLLRQDIDLRAANSSARLDGLTQESSGSLRDIRTVLSEVAQLLYPHANPNSSDIARLIPGNSSGAEISDPSWLPSLRNSSQRSPVIFHLIDQQIATLAAQSLANVSTLRRETEAQGEALQQLLNVSEARLLGEVAGSSALLRQLIASLNQSLAADREAAVLSALSLEVLLSESADNLTTMVRTTALHSEKELTALETTVNKTFSEWRLSFREALAELRNQTTAESSRLESMSTLLNHSLQLGHATLASALTSSSAELAANVSQLSLTTQTNISSLRNTLMEALEAAQDLILNQTLRPWQHFLDSQLNATQTQIAALNSSAANSVRQLSENSSVALALLARNLSAETETLFKAIAQSNRSGAENLRALGNNLTAELSAVNRSLSQLDTRVLLLATNLSLQESSQATLWLQNFANLTALADTARSLSVTITEVNRSLGEAVVSSSALLSANWSRSLSAVNSSLSTSIASSSESATALVNRLNSSLSAALLADSQELRTQLSRQESQANQSQLELRALLEERSSQTRTALSAQMNLTRQETIAALSLTNRTLLAEMATLSAEVSLGLRLSLENTSRLLALQSSAQDGQLTLLSHRAGALENISAQLSQASSSSALQVALLNAEVAQLTVSLGATRDEQLLLRQSLRQVELELGNASSLLSSSHNQLSTLRSDQSFLQTQFSSLLLNSSANAAALAQIFSFVNGSQQLVKLALEESRSRCSRLETELEAGRWRTEALEGELRNVSHVALPFALSRMEEVGSAAVKEQGRLEERLGRAEARVGELGAADESLGKRVVGLELETKSLRDTELMVLRKGLEESKERCDALTGELRKEVGKAQEDREAQQKRLRELSEKMSVLETRAGYQDKRIAELVEENEKMRRSLASQSSVDDLRKLIQDLQSSMLSHSNKVLDVVITKLASPSPSKDNKN